MKIEEILRSKGRNVVTITRERTVLEAVKILEENNIGGIVVMEGDRPVGIVTERDVLRLTARSPGELGSITVSSVIVRELIVARPEDQLREAMQVMTEERIRHLPVMEGKQLVGIISIGDLLNACRIVAERENAHLREYIQGAVPYTPPS
jgi:CBS domain-containing protein